MIPTVDRPVPTGAERAAGPSASEKDLLLQSRIQSVLDRDPAMNAGDVLDVSVTAGTADIGGVVDRWEQHRRATRDAFSAGAKRVVNHVRVRDDPTGSNRSFVYRNPNRT